MKDGEEPVSCQFQGEVVVLLSEDTRCGLGNTQFWSVVDHEVAMEFDW